MNKIIIIFVLAMFFGCVQPIEINNTTSVELITWKIVGNTLLIDNPENIKCFIKIIYIDNIIEQYYCSGDMTITVTKTVKDVRINK